MRAPSFILRPGRGGRLNAVLWTPGGLLTQGADLFLRRERRVAALPSSGAASATARLARKRVTSQAL